MWGCCARSVCIILLQRTNVCSKWKNGQWVNEARGINKSISNRNTSQTGAVLLLAKAELKDGGGK